LERSTAEFVKIRYLLPTHGQGVSSMKRILVPVDGSEFAERAIGPALALAARHDAELHLVSVVSNVPPLPVAFADDELIGRWVEEDEARVRQYTDRVAAESAERAEGVEVRTHVLVGRVSPKIQELAQELEADLVVLTTHGRGAASRAILGSIADQLLRRLDRALLLLPCPENDGELPGIDSIRHVLVPLDGSRAAERALETLPTIVAPDRGARLTLACVVEEGFPIPSVYLPDQISEERFRELQEKKAHEYLDRVAEGARAHGFRLVEPRVITATDPARGLLHLSRDSGVEMIALSTHGRGGASRLLLGSVAGKLLAGAHVPVFVTRRPANERE
jgi:nucleotide-binding universal stress UspA family protein